jgi:hypothetical protein
MYDGLVTVTTYTDLHEERNAAIDRLKRWNTV